MPDLRWPYDQGVDWGTHLAGPDAEEMGRRYTQACWLKLLVRATSGSTRSRLAQQLPELLFALYCGTAVPYVEGKLQFAQIAAEIGYCAPRSVLYTPSRPDPDLLPAIQALDVGSALRFCKPLHGCKGRGIYVAPTPQAALRFVSGQQCHYLIQEVMPPVDGECRYVLHRTAQDLEVGSPPSVRLAVERIGPTVVGNGHSTVTELIRKLRRSQADKMKLAYGVAVNRVPARGERVELVASGNIGRLVKNRRIGGERLKTLDVYMLGFLAALENYLGGTIATLCVDVGLTPNGPVLYEWQQQFAVPTWKPARRSQRGSTRRLRQSILRSAQLAVAVRE